ncbi:TPA: hypothetical protein ACY3JH_002909 [Klebsiella aerogenes]
MTDITELAQMKGQKVEGSYYLAECTDCGKMYPSNKLNGGEPLFSGDYGECYCPHCNADDAAIGDCGDTAAKSWNYQQDRIDALVEALEKAQKSNEFLKGQLSELANFNPDWDKLEASYESWREIAAELLVAKERIAELQIVRDKCFLSGLKTGWEYGTNHDGEGYNREISDAQAVIERATGIKWEAE